MTSFFISEATSEDTLKIVDKVREFKVSVDESKRPKILRAAKKLLPHDTEQHVTDKKKYE